MKETIIIRVEQGVVTQVLTNIKDLDVTVTDLDITDADHSQVIELYSSEVAVYGADTRFYEPMRTEIIKNAILAQQGMKYYVFGFEFSELYYGNDVDFAAILKEIEANYSSYTFALHKYAPPYDIERILSDHDGYNGYAEVTRYEWYQLSELKETMDHGKKN